MLNSVAAGRRQAHRVLAAQVAATLIAALVFLVQGEQAALGALFGGAAVALGTALMAWRAFGGGIGGAGSVLFRLFGGLALRWLVIGVALLLALGPLALPPLPVIIGLGVALAATLLGFGIKS